MGPLANELRETATFRPQAVAIVTAWWYWARLGFVGIVSAYDTYLTFVLRDVILFTEQNPMGLWLIRLDPHRLIYFTVAKTVGTLTVLTLMGVVAPWISAPRGAHPSPENFRVRQPGQGRLLVREVIKSLGHMTRRYREPIVTSLATFQLWLLWYLSTE